MYHSIEKRKNFKFYYKCSSFWIVPIRKTNTQLPVTNSSHSVGSYYPLTKRRWIIKEWMKIQNMVETKNIHLAYFINAISPKQISHQKFYGDSDSKYEMKKPFHNMDVHPYKVINCCKIIVLLRTHKFIWTVYTIR